MVANFFSEVALYDASFLPDNLGQLHRHLSVDLDIFLVICRIRVNLDDTDFI